MNNGSIIHIDFADALKIWSLELWPGRKSKIEPVSAIAEDGSIDMQLMNSSPVFLAYQTEAGLQGIISGFKTSQTKFRSRGLWVSPGLRGKGLGCSLMSELISEAKNSGCCAMWTMARFDAWPFYQKAGFIKTLDIDKYEFGPHIICEKSW